MHIVEYFNAEFKKDTGIDLKGDKLALQRLREEAEKAKKELQVQRAVHAERDRAVQERAVRRECGVRCIFAC